MLRGEREATLVGCRSDVVDLDEPCRGLLLEPLTCVARVDVRRRRKLACRETTTLVKGAVEPQAIADVDGEDIDRTERGVEQAPHELLCPLDVDLQLLRHHLLLSGPFDRGPTGSICSRSTAPRARARLEPSATWPMVWYRLSFKNPCWRSTIASRKCCSKRLRL